jgi:hypothetical protein
MGNSNRCTLAEATRHAPSPTKTMRSTLGSPRVVVGAAISSGCGCVRGCACGWVMLERVDRTALQYNAHGATRQAATARQSAWPPQTWRPVRAARRLRESRPTARDMSAGRRRVNMACVPSRCARTPSRVQIPAFRCGTRHQETAKTPGTGTV